MSKLGEINGFRIGKEYVAYRTSFIRKILCHLRKDSSKEAMELFAEITCLKVPANDRKISYYSMTKKERQSLKDLLSTENDSEVLNTLKKLSAIKNSDN